MRGSFGNEQQRELAKLFNGPKVIHRIRLTNKSKYPLTTAPALLVRDGQVLAQGLMTYTSTGASVDLTIATAVDIPLKKSELETKRTPNAPTEIGSSYSRIVLAGKLTLTSRRARPVELEGTRYVPGTADSAGQNGKIEKFNTYENGEYLGGGDYPDWWGWYGWPNWWSYLNGVARVTWTVNLAPEESAGLDYAWPCFWR